jgi:hypothetical protein
MTNEELTAIEARVTAISTAFSLDVEEALWESAQDVPALVAEVRTLRAELDAELAAFPPRHDALIIAEGQRDQARAERDQLREQWSGLLIEQTRLMTQRDDAIIELSLANAQRGVLAKENMALGAELDALRTVAAFFRSVILSGEQWSDHCQTMYDAALAVQP